MFYRSSYGDADALFCGLPTLGTESGCFSRDVALAKISHLKEWMRSNLQKNKKSFDL